MNIEELATAMGRKTREAVRASLDDEAALQAVTSRERVNRRTTIAVAIAVAVTLAAVLVAQLMRPDAPALNPSPAPAAPTATPTATPSPTSAPTPHDADHSLLADVRLVELRGGTSTDLPRSIRSINSVQNFETSPDGDQLAFYGDGSIYVAGLDGALPRKLCSASPYAAPSWAPDGQSLVFSEDRALRVVDVSTGEVRRITTGEHPIHTPDFSPDGGTVLFTMQHNDALALWNVSSQGGDPVLLLDRAAFGTYSPDGRSIAFRRTDFVDGDYSQMSNGSVWLASASGGNPRRIGPSTAWMSQISSSALWPAWSPDGTRIAYEPLMGRPLRVVDVSTGRTHTVATGTKVDWLDDDTLIVGDATLTPG